LEDSSEEEDTVLGKLYLQKLRRLLKWPLARIRPDRFMETLPSSFLQEKALILGRIGRHEDALRILYRDLNSLDLALEYCDDRFEQQKVQQEERRGMLQPQWSGDSNDGPPPEQEDNAYLPLVRVALDSEDTERGVTAAIQVLALRRSAIDRAAALRLLPSGVPVSAVARPFLIPALVDSESHVRRLTVVSALLRARYLRLKEELTVAQLKAQANLHVVAQFRNIELGDILHSTKPFRVRTSTTASSTMPDLMVVKHFFPRHLVIQAKITNTTGGGPSTITTDSGIATAMNSNQMGRFLTDVVFVVAESSEEAIQPMLHVPIKVLPVQMTGSAWCVLSADLGHMDGATATLTCELRYTVQPLDFSGTSRASSSSSSSSGIVSSPASSLGRTFVEELQDMEVHAAHFS
jgi:Vam6/Vps39-like protein vacuolar protein sorting-associated protein 39